MSNPNKSIPVIFLAFANDQVDNANYLRGLKKERDGIRQALKIAEKAGLCKLVERTNATIQNILDVFQDYQDRVAIFHYGGHANGYQLLLETLEGDHSSAYSEGLVSFFSKQRGLKLIFLNGCSSQQQALDLVESGIPAVIGTSQSINDHVATKLAIRFYKGLAVGKTIDRAWREAIDEVKIEKGTSNLRDLFWEGATTLEKTEDRKLEASPDRFPWEIYYKEGAEAVKEWDLPEAVENPLFGLPPIPQIHHLPKEPFLFFKRYERQHAEVFFGRASFIRKLYNLVTSVVAPPIILLFGQSGAGKSSLLDAGLLPRIELDYHALYVRRSASLGLVETMRKALNAQLNPSLNQPNPILVPSIEEKKDKAPNPEILIKGLLDLAKSHPFYAKELERLAKQAKADNARQTKQMEGEGVAALWHRLEAKTQKPVMLILDQAEEMFTHPNTTLKDESKTFFKELFELFGNKQLCPKGRLMLAFRKEFAAEIERDMGEAHLPFSKVFLTKLDRLSIIEAITGLTSNEKLRTKYNLTIEPNLPVIIADDLLEDQESPIAPVLQILLTKMWEEAIAMNPEAPVFSEKLYQRIKVGGLLMEDFLHQQLSKVAEKYPTDVESGLVLDLLHFHTTKRRTSASQDEKIVLARYEDKQEMVKNLLQELTNLCLLVPVTDRIKKLTHDTLAQIVSQKFNESVSPGQRAMRILSYKMVDYAAGQEVLLDASDVRIIQEGLKGMRKLTEKEEELLQRSREEIDRRVVVQARKDAEIVFFRERSEEKELESSLLRLKGVMEDEFSKSTDRSVAIAQSAFNKFPDSREAISMVYMLMNRLVPEERPLTEFQELFKQDHNEDLQALQPEEGSQTPQYITSNNDWSIIVTFPSRVTIYDAFGEVEHAINIVIRDYGLLRSLVILPDNEHFVVCTNDGLVKMFDHHTEKIMEIGSYDQESAHHYLSAVYDEASNSLVMKGREQLHVYPLSPQDILRQLDPYPLSDREKREFDISW